MGRYLLASIGGGILFGILDGVINANPLAQRLYGVYSPIMRRSVNIFPGMGIDLAYGFIMAAVYLLLYQSLPGETILLKGLSFGLLVWFFRVLMSAASSWVMFDIPASLIIYNIMTGLAEMAIIGLFYGLTLKP